MQLHFFQFVVEKGWKQASYILLHKILVKRNKIRRVPGQKRLFLINNIFLKYIHLPNSSDGFTIFL